MDILLKFFKKEVSIHEIVLLHVHVQFVHHRCHVIVYDVM